MDELMNEGINECLGMRRIVRPTGISGSLLSPDLGNNIIKHFLENSTFSGKRTYSKKCPGGPSS